jgi:head-tail adaptor
MIINGRMFVNPGELTTSILLERRVITQDAGGAQQKGYTTVATRKAKWVNAHGNDVQAAGGNFAEAPADVTFRYVPGLDCACVVNKGGIQYEIIGDPDDVHDKHLFHVVHVLRMKAG